MSFDMSQFYQVFFEEAAEHLASMENLLLGLDVDTPDAEQLNAIFRAAHSIKGSAGTFGFTDLAEVTHVLENLLDRIRKGELPLRNDMIDAFLDAGDVLKQLLAAHRGEGAADPALVAQTCSRLNELTGGRPIRCRHTLHRRQLSVTPNRTHRLLSGLPSISTKICRIHRVSATTCWPSLRP